MATTLRLDTALYGSAVLLDRLLGLLLLPLLARAIDRTDYGAWTQTAVAASVLMPLVLFAFSTTIVRSFSGSGGGALRPRFFGRLGAVALGLFALCAVLLLAWRDSVAEMVYGVPAAQALIVPLLLLLAADAGTEFAMAWLRSLGRMGLVAGALALRSALRYGAVLLLVGGGGRPLVEWLTTFAVVQTALALALLVGTWLWLRRDVEATPPSAAEPTLAELLAFSAPLVLLALFTSVNAYVDRFLLVQVLGLDAVAVYAAAVSLCSLPSVFYSVLGFTLFPVLARHWNDQRPDEAARLTTLALQVFLFLCLPVSLLIALAGPLLLPLLTTAEYRAAPAVFALLSLSVTAFGLYQIMLYALLLDGRSRQVLLLATAAAAVNLVLNLLLAPRLGATGAATAAAASNALMVVLAARLARRAMPWRFPWQRLWPITWRAAVAALPLGGWLLLASAPTSWLAFCAMLAVCTALYLGLDLVRAGSITRTLIPRRAVA